MPELLPVAGGLLIGALLGWLRPPRRLPSGILACTLIGLLATVVSGEFLISWGFLLVDLPLAALGSLIGLRMAAVLHRSQPG